MIRQLWLEKPKSSDGFSVNQLIARCEPLDTNSTYCNILQCEHFADTSIVARAESGVVGFISGYRMPQRLNSLFIWQVAVDPNQRGAGLASKMLDSLLTRSDLRNVEYIETTITADNQASWSLFTKLAHRLQTELKKAEHYRSLEHFGGQHDSEWLVRIGPIKH